MKAKVVTNHLRENMHAPQITLLVLWALSLGITSQKHGKPRTGNEDVFAHLIAVAVNAAILAWGGFWN